MRFYKAKIILTTSFLVVNLINTTANAVELGQRCAVVGATVLQDGRLYTCLSNKTWNRGMLQAAPAPEVITPIPVVAPPTPVVVTPTPTVVTPTPAVVTPSPTRAVVTPSPTPAVVTQSPVVATPTPAVVTPSPTRAVVTPSPTPAVVTPSPTPAVVTQSPVVATPTPAVVTPTPTNTMTDKNGNTLVAPKDISIRCKSMSSNYDITNVTGPNPKCPLNYRLLLPNDPEYNGPIGGVTSTTPVVSPAPTPNSVGTAPIPEYVWCVHSLTGRSVRSVTPYKPSCPKGYTARDYYGIPTSEVIKLGEPKPSPSPLIRTVKVCYKSTDKKRVNGVTVFRESVTGEQPNCPAGYK